MTGPTHTPDRVTTQAVIPEGRAASRRRRWQPRSLGLIVLVWLILHVGGLFSPGLLDDVDSVYLEIAREMLARHDFITPYVDGIRFFDKPPLMYWLAAGSMRLLGVHDWAGRLPLALLTLGLLLVTYALGIRLFARASPAHAPDRAGLYAAIALGTCIGPYLYTRFFIPDIVLTLWLALGIALFLIAVDRAETGICSTLPPMLGGAAVLALNVLTKGLVGLLLMAGFAVLYLALRQQLRLLRHLFLAPSAALFLLVAAPWHLLAWLRNRAVVMPPGVGLPPRAGWVWFYLYNEHIARFLSLRVPHDYGQVPVPLFWMLALFWLFPWVTFLPAALREQVAQLRRWRSLSSREQEVGLAPLLWAGLVLGFFTLSARQEYYSLPALPALALLVGGSLARADRGPSPASNDIPGDTRTMARMTARTIARQRQSTLGWSRWLLVPSASLVAAICLALAAFAPSPPPGASLADLLAQHPDAYDLSLGHLFDLTGAAMGLFRAPLCALAFGMLTLGPAAHLLRRRGRTGAANATLAAGATLVLLAMHTGLVRFYPILGSEALAASIRDVQQRSPRGDDLLLIDGELTAGSSLLFYTGEPAHFVNGRVNGPWFGSFWPDAPQVFETDATLDRLWSTPRRVFLLTYHPQARRAELARFGPVYLLSIDGGKTILTNLP